MEAEKRRKYLRAMGVDIWVPRTAALSDEPEVMMPDVVKAVAVAGTKTTAAAVAPVSRIAEPKPVAEPIAIPSDWTGLRAMVKDCTRCKLCSTRTKTVFGVGPESAPLMVIGEGPGADEDAQGEPFVGRAGKLLDEMLAAIGRSRRDNVFIANVVKCRPPGNRDPESDEVEACRPYLDQQIRLIKPKLIVGLGRIAAQRLLATDAPLSRLRGPLQHYGPEKVPLFITYHPAYLLRSPREKAKSWDDLKKVWRYLRDQQQ
ncbi:MAG: uracil-DNA glycosylase [Panacagrimonas sp.]